MPWIKVNSEPPKPTTFEDLGYVQVVRCKHCIHNGKVEKCVLAAIAAEKDYPLFMLDNRGDWFCADGERRDGDG